MSDEGAVLVVDDTAPAAIEERLTDRGLEVVVATDLRSALSTLSEDDRCVVCSQLSGHTVAELVSRLGAPARPVVFVYDDDDDEAATTALDAGAAATIHRQTGSAWGAHLGATVDRIRRRSVDRPEAAPLVENALDELTDIFFVISVEGEFLRWNAQLVETTGYTHEEIADLSPTDFFEGEDVRRIENAIGRVVMNGRASEVADVVPKEGPAIAHEFTGSLVEAGHGRAIVGIGRDIRERRARERELERQAEQLRTLDHVNAVIRGVVRTLLESENRDEIEQAVCTRLTDDDPYRFAWIGEYDADRGRVEPRAWAGEGEEYLAERPTGADDEELTTALTAIREREIMFAQDIADDPVSSGWRAAALEYGHESAAAIPLVLRDSTYGCLCLYAGRPDAFGSLEREVLAELGGIIAHAIRGVEARRALAADTVTRLRLRITEPDVFLVQAATRTDGRLELVSSVGRPDGAIIQLFSVRAIPGDAVEVFADQSPYDVEVVTARDDESLIRVTLPEGSLPHALADVGGTLSTVTAADGECHLVVEAPTDVDVETVLERVRTVYEVQLLSQRQVDREPTTALEFGTTVDRQLTERQLEVMETAYRAGFFDWPREQTGKEVADLLDVAQPTFHQHLRIGQRKLLEVLFDHRRSRTDDAEPTGASTEMTDDAGAEDEPEVGPDGEREATPDGEPEATPDGEPEADPEAELDSEPEGSGP